MENKQTSNNVSSTPSVETLSNPASSPANASKLQDKAQGKAKPKNTAEAIVTLETVMASPKLTAEYIDKLLKKLADEKTPKLDKKTVRRFLRQLGHKGGLRASKYSKSKSIADFVK